MQILKHFQLSAVVMLLAVCAPVFIPVFAMSGDSEAAQVLERLDIPYERFTLENGLTVIVHSDHKAPVVSVAVWYHVGSKDEPEGRHGYAHLFEHLMTTGSENFPNSYLKAYEGVGATKNNATTWFDRTNYYQTVPSTALERALWLESDRMIYMVEAITQETLDQQRGIVRSEHAGRSTGIYGDWESRQLAGLLPADHPYRHVTLGSLEDLDKTSVADAKDWFSRYYGAANATLVIAGDVSIDEARTLVEKYFSAARPGPAINRTTEWVPVRPDHKVDVIQTKLEKPNLVRMWSVPAWRSRDVVLLSLAAGTLSRGSEGFLHDRLVKTGIVEQILVQVMPFELTSQFKISLGLRSMGDEAGASAALDQALAGFFIQGPDSELLQKQRNNSELMQIAGLESVTNIGKLLAEGELYAGDPLHFKKQFEWAASATTDDIRMVAKSWLSKGYYQASLRPTAKFTATADAADRSVLPVVPELQELSLPEVQEFSLKNGMPVALIQRPGIPLLRVSVLFPISTAGSTGHSASARDALIQISQGGPSKRIRVISKDDFVSYSSSMISTESGPAFDQLFKAVSAPEFENSSIKSAASGQPATTAGPDYRAVLESAIFGTPLQAMSESAPGSHSIDDVIGFHRSNINPDNAKIFVTGDISAATLTKILNNSFGKWRMKKSPDRSPSDDISKPPQEVAVVSTAKVILIDKPGAVQTGIFGGQVSMADTDPDFEAFEIANRIFGAMGTGRLHQNLREDKSWTYVATSGHRKVGEQYVWGFSSFVQADKTSEAISEIIKELDLFTGDQPPTAIEVQSVIGSERGKLSTSLESGGQLQYMMIDAAMQGRPASDTFRQLSNGDEISVGAVQRAAKHGITPTEIVWLIVGDLSVIEADIRALGLGDITLHTQ